MLVPRSEFVDWLEELKQQGKRILIISDIYLPAAHLKRLSEKAGLMKYAEAVISLPIPFWPRHPVRPIRSSRRNSALRNQPGCMLATTPFQMACGRRSSVFRPLFSMMREKNGERQ